MVRYCHQTAIRLPSDFRLIRLSEQPVNGVSVCVRENKTAPLTESLLSLATSFGMIFAGNGKVDKSNSSIYLQVLHEGDEARTVLLAGSSQRIPICFTYQFFIVLHQSRPNLPRDIMLRIESPKSIDFMSPWRRLRGRGGEATGTCRFPHGHRKVNFWHPDVPPEMFTGNVWSLGRAADVLKRWRWRKLVWPQWVPDQGVAPVWPNHPRHCDQYVYIIQYNIYIYVITNVQYNANITTISGFPLHCVQAPWFAGGPGFASPSVWRQFTAPKGIQDLLMWCDKCGIFVCCKVMGYYLKKVIQVQHGPTETFWNVQKRSHRLHRMKSSGRGRGDARSIRKTWNLIQVEQVASYDRHDHCMRVVR